LWYTNVNGEIKISDALWKAIKERIKGKAAGEEIREGEILQVIRALDAVGNKTDFGFSDNNGQEANYENVADNEKKAQDGGLKPKHGGERTRYVSEEKPSEQGQYDQKRY